MPLVFDAYPFFERKRAGCDKKNFYFRGCCHPWQYRFCTYSFLSRLAGIGHRDGKGLTEHVASEQKKVAGWTWLGTSDVTVFWLARGSREGISGW